MESFFWLRFLFTIFYRGSFQVPPEKNHPHLKCQFPPKIPIWPNCLLYKCSEKWPCKLKVYKKIFPGLYNYNNEKRGSSCLLRVGKTLQWLHPSLFTTSLFWVSLPFFIEFSVSLSIKPIFEKFYPPLTKVG